MKTISILDCTLRDGGYINDWKFGCDAIRDIVRRLDGAGIDIIECGFLRDVPYNRDASVFSAVEQIEPFIAPKREDALYVAMIAIGDIAPEKISPCSRNGIDGIRLTFHKHELHDAVGVGRALMKKGYKIFMQPVGTVTYSDLELLELTREINEMRPYAFYIVDTLGSMYENDVLHMFQMVDKNLASGIRLGFHSHNNLQLAFSNAQAIIRLRTRRQVILDSSVFGMGRGAGNLCTELITRYLNMHEDGGYNQVELMEIVDRYLIPIRNVLPWGYTMPYYLAASKQCHPNYAEYLINKETLTVKSIDELLECIPREERPLYNKKRMEQLYRAFQRNEIDDARDIQALAAHFANRSILVIGPGGSIVAHEKRIQNYIKEAQPLVVSVNFVPDRIRVDWLFVSNRKRFSSLHALMPSLACKVIATSNLGEQEDRAIYHVNYADYLYDGQEGDNAAAMLMRLLIRLGASKITYAGLDGFSVEKRYNYCDAGLESGEQQRRLDEKNAYIRTQLQEIRKRILLVALTPSKYEE